MAIRFQTSVLVEDGREIAVHPEATHYAIKGRKLLFYMANPRPTEKMRPIPRNINTMRFPDYRRHIHWIHYGKPEFSGHGR